MVCGSLIIYLCLLLQANKRLESKVLPFGSVRPGFFCSHMLLLVFDISLPNSRGMWELGVVASFMHVSAVDVWFGYVTQFT